MYGTKPYASDPHVVLHNAHTKLQVERGPGDFVVLSGVYGKAWFGEVFEVPVYNGMQMMIF